MSLILSIFDFQCILMHLSMKLKLQVFLVMAVYLSNCIFVMVSHIQCSLNSISCAFHQNLIQDISVELLSLLILCAIVFKPWHLFVLSELKSSVVKSLWYVLNKTRSYWSHQGIEKCCFNVALCIVVVGTFLNLEWSSVFLLTLS